MFAVLLAMLLLPITNYLAGKGLHRILSIGLPVLLTLILFGGLIYFLSAQIINFLDDAPELKKKLSEVGASAQKWINQHIHITVRKQNEYIKETVEDIKDQRSQTSWFYVWLPHRYPCIHYPFADLHIPDVILPETHKDFSGRRIQEWFGRTGK